MEKAYLIMVHKNPGQVYRLIERLNDKCSQFFIHIDSKVSKNPFEILNDFGNIIHFIDRFDATWGRTGLIEPSLAGMRAIRSSGKSFDRIILLSGQDYPIKSNEYINSFFKNSKHSSFINYFPIPNYEKWPGSDRGGLYRVDKYYFGNKWYNFLCSKSLNLLSQFLPFLGRRIPYGLKPFAGQTWWNMDLNTMNYVLDFNEKHPRLITFLQNTFVADELFIQIIIGNAKDQKMLEKIENNEKRFTIWEKANSAHPKILSASDISAIKSSNDLFARKFDDSVDSTIMDLIDRDILRWRQQNSSAA